jgi:transposase-like protein
MKIRRHTPEQVIRKLAEGDRLLAQGKTVEEVARHLEISEQTFHRWRNQYGGMKADDAKRLKELEKENGRLKKIWPTRRSTSTCSRSWLRETSDPGPSPGRRGAARSSVRGLREKGLPRGRPGPLHPAPPAPGAP